MISENPVTSVLVTSGNSTLLAAGNPVTALAPGQIGMFSYQDNLSINGSVAATSRDFYIAVGVDRNGDATTDDIVKSSGSHIQTRNIDNVTLRCYSPGQPNVVRVSGLAASCETEYGIKIEFQNTELGYTHGFNFPSKTYMTKTSCCDDCATTCPDGDCNELARNLFRAVNADADGLAFAEMYDETGSAVVTEAGYATWVAANPGKCLAVNITSIPSSIYTYSSINLKYTNPRETKLTVSLVEGFGCSGIVTVVQPLIFQEGAGYDVAQLEYENAPQMGLGSIYRVSDNLGMAIDGVGTLAVKNGQYLMYTITNRLESQEGEAFQNSMSTIIAIPCADTTTRTAFVAAMDSLTAAKFEQLASDNTACPACNVANTTDQKSVTTDGIA